jgi:mono/diheme cytochrome c family protein
MDRQPKFKPQAESRFFSDGNTDRPLPANVVARGRTPEADAAFLAADDHYFRGYQGVLGLPDATDWYRGFPAGAEITREFIQRGAERYAVFCAPCHGALGDGNGITKQYGMGATPTYHSDRIRAMPEGEIFNTITNGRNTMYGYGDRIPAAERWAIVAYVRALQRAQQGRVEDVPAASRAELGL